MPCPVEAGTSHVGQASLNPVLSESLRTGRGRSIARPPSGRKAMNLFRRACTNRVWARGTGAVRERQNRVVQAVAGTCMSPERKRNGRCGHGLAQGPAGDRRARLSLVGKEWPKWRMRQRAGRTEIGGDVCVWPNETNECVPLSPLFAYRGRPSRGHLAAGQRFLAGTTSKRPLNGLLAIRDGRDGFLFYKIAPVF